MTSVPRADWSAARLATLIVATTVIRGWIASVLPLSGDEAYYYDCSRHPDWCYFDQPGLVIWAIAPFRTLLGDCALAVRMPALLAGLAVGLAVWRIMSQLGGSRREVAIAWGLLHATPLFFFGSGYASTDVAMIACYGAATAAAISIAGGDRRAWWAFGAAVGIGFLAKFPIVLVLGTLIPLLGSGVFRRDLRSATPWLAALLSVVLSLPVWIWGLQHDWAHLRFQFGRVPDGFSPLDALGFVAASIASMTPTIGIAVCIAWFVSRRSHSGPGWSVMRAAIATPIVFWTVLALRGHVGAHWGAPGMLYGIVPVVLVAFPRRRALIRVGIATGAVLIPLILSVPAFPEVWIDVERQIRQSQGRPQKLELANLFGEHELAAELARRLRPGEFAASERYTDLHLASFLSEGRLPLLLFRGREHGLASLYWHRPEDLLGRDLLAFSKRAEIADQLRPIFDSVEAEGDLVVELQGVVLRRWHFFRCRGLRDPRAGFTRL